MEAAKELKEFKESSAAVSPSRTAHEPHGPQTQQSANTVV